jgi:hypothetical protein
MEAAVQRQLQRYLLNNNLISTRQFGFRPSNSTAVILNIMSRKWNNFLDQCKEICVIIALDIKGAFDKGWQKELEGCYLGYTISCLTDLSTSSYPARHLTSHLSMFMLLFSVMIDDLVDIKINLF